MAEHNLFRGAGATSNPGYRMLPSTDVEPDGVMEAAAHKTPVVFALSWGLAPTEGLPFTGVRDGFKHQAEYFRCLDAPLAVGDVIQAVIMPKFSTLFDLWYFNCEAIPGLEMELRVRGNADSLGGTAAAPAPITLATINFGDFTGGSLVDFSAVSAGDGDADSGEDAEADTDVAGAAFHHGVYFDQNDMLQLVVTAVPANFDPSCIRFGMSPIVREYCRGDMIECLVKGDGMQK